MGEVIPSWNGDGVFTGRESHTSHRSQMKLFKAIAAAAVVGTSLLVSSPVEAAGCYDSLIVDDMNSLIMEGKSLQEAWQEQVRLGNSDGSDYCWRRAKSYLITYRSIMPALYNAVYK